MSVRAVSVGNMRPMCCYEVEGMFLIPDGRCAVRCFRGAETTELAVRIRDFLKLPDGLQFELHNAGDADCQVRTLLSPSPSRRLLYDDSELRAPQATVSPPAAV
jgi:hypothetical protein